MAVSLKWLIPMFNLGFLFRLMIIFSLPVLAAVANANESYEIIKNGYKNEFVVLLCLLLIAVGAVASIATPDPEGHQKISPLSKFCIAIFGGICALVYLAYQDNGVTILHAVWAGGVTFVSPTVIPLLKPILIELVPEIGQYVKARILRFFK